MKDKAVVKQTYREAVAYVGTNGVRIDALADVDTVWLNRQQLATLFGRQCLEGGIVRISSCRKNCDNCRGREDLSSGALFARYDPLHRLSCQIIRGHPF